MTQRRFSVACDIEVLAEDEVQAERVVNELLRDVQHSVGDIVDIDDNEAGA